MDEIKALVSLGEISKPATVLVEKISDAIGGVFRPYQIRRVATAEADAERIRAVAHIDVTELERRAMSRLFAEEAKRQENIESVIRKALPAVAGDATPNSIEDDWIVNFFDKCRLISNEEMQRLWSKVLAGETNSPGRYSKRTVNVLSSLDKADAELFQTLCSFAWDIHGPAPLIYDALDEIYTDAGITFNALTHLDEIGLLTFTNLTGFKRIKLKKNATVWYYGKRIEIEFPQPEDNQMDIGKVLLSKAGQELAGVCGSAARPHFFEYVMRRWQASNLNARQIA